MGGVAERPANPPQTAWGGLLAVLYPFQEIETMTPSHAITSATELPDHLDRLTAQLRDEIAEMQEQWDRLGSVGGQRDDHAAQLLQWMKPHLQEIARYATACNAQVEQMAADPFGRTDAA